MRIWQDLGIVALIWMGAIMYGLIGPRSFAIIAAFCGYVILLHFGRQKKATSNNQQ